MIPLFPLTHQALGWGWGEMDTTVKLAIMLTTPLVIFFLFF